jgi:hypothetical protein
MKTTGKFIHGALLGCIITLTALAQEAVPGKVYVAEMNGGVTFTADGKLVELKKGLSLPVQGARIETFSAAYLILVCSNGTSIYFDEKTIVEIDNFMQKPFPAGTDTSVIEPSVSNTLCRVLQGRVIITTNKLATGTSMIYLSPHGEIRIRGQEVVIEVNDHETRVIVVLGDVTVLSRNGPTGNVGQVLQSGQMAVLTNSSATDIAGNLQVSTADPAVVSTLAPKIEAAERARRIVRFESVSSGDNPPEVQARVVVPVDLPVNLTVSPSTLRTGG